MNFSSRSFVKSSVERS